MNAEILMLIGGVSSFLLTVNWVRKRDLRERYAIGWMTTATVILICGLFPDIIKRAAEACQLTYPALVLYISLACGYVFLFFVSVSLTRQYRRTMRLAQELALLQQQLIQFQREESASSSPANSSLDD